MWLPTVSRWLSGSHRPRFNAFISRLRSDEPRESHVQKVQVHLLVGQWRSIIETRPDQLRIDAKSGYRWVVGSGERAGGRGEGAPRNTWLPRNVIRGNSIAGEMDCGHDSVILYNCLDKGPGLVYKEGTEPLQVGRKLTGSKEAAVRVRSKSKLRETLNEVSREGTTTTIYQKAMSKC